jgi:hypothetical protein
MPLDIQDIFVPLPYQNCKIISLELATASSGWFIFIFNLLMNGSVYWQLSSPKLLKRFQLHLVFNVYNKSCWAILILAYIVPNISSTLHKSQVEFYQYSQNKTAMELSEGERLKYIIQVRYILITGFA